MPITKTTAIDQITVTENGTVFYRQVTRIMEDGQQLSQTYYRTSLTPGQDLAEQPAQVAAIAAVAWTPEVITAYQTQQSAALE